MIRKELSSMGVTEKLLKDDDFGKMLENIYLVCHDYITRLMKNKYRQHREITKIYQYLSVIVHDANEFDSAH